MHENAFNGIEDLIVFIERHGQGRILDPFDKDISK